MLNKLFPNWLNSNIYTFGSAKVADENLSAPVTITGDKSLLIDNSFNELTSNKGSFMMLNCIKDVLRYVAVLHLSVQRKLNIIVPKEKCFKELCELYAITNS